MTDDMHSVNTFVTEANSFIDRNNLADRPVAATMGGLFWGLMRAVMECPDCPGHFRVPAIADGEECITCTNCGGVWVYRPQAQEKPKKGRRE